MLKLNLARTPHWLDLGHGVRLHVEPLTSALMMRPAPILRWRLFPRALATRRWRSRWQRPSRGGRCSTGKASAMPRVGRCQ